MPAISQSVLKQIPEAVGSAVRDAFSAVTAPPSELPQWTDPYTYSAQYMWNKGKDAVKGAGAPVKGAIKGQPLPKGAASKIGTGVGRAASQIMGRRMPGNIPPERIKEIMEMIRQQQQQGPGTSGPSVPPTRFPMPPRPRNIPPMQPPMSGPIQQAPMPMPQPPRRQPPLWGGGRVDESRRNDAIKNLIMQNPEMFIQLWEAGVIDLNQGQRPGIRQPLAQPGRPSWRNVPGAQPAGPRVQPMPQIPQQLLGQ